MKTRAAELRARHRRIFAWSLGVAALLHLALFFLTPVFEAEPFGGMEVRGDVTTGTDGPLILLDVLFGPPTILSRDGGRWTEPPERVLGLGRFVRLPPECEGWSPEGRAPLSGSVRLRVDASGHAAVVELAASSGEPCGDEALTTLADALRYHWLPNDRFAAPVHVIQPVTVAEARARGEE